MSDKVAYTPVEFAAMFSREKTWTYRLIYSNKIEAIFDLGRIMIPANQIARLESHATRYGNRKKLPIEMTATKAMPPVKSNSRWVEWIAKRRTKAKFLKRMVGSFEQS